MTFREAWERLGIAPTADAREVKRAYARRLKALGADADREAFIALREAYETALASGGEIPSWEYGDGTEAEEALEPVHAQEQWDEAPWPAGADPLLLSWGGPPARPLLPDLPPGPLAEAIRALDEALFAPGGDPQRVAAAGAELLRALDTAPVGEAIDAEPWLAAAIAASIPRSDPLVRPVVDRFGWQKVTPDRHWSWDMDIVLGRAADLPFVRSCRRPGSSHHPAYVELTGPPRERVRLGELGLAGDVRDLLRIAEERHPTLEQDFNPRSVQWWRAYFHGPHLPTGLTPVLLLLPFCVAAGAMLFLLDARFDALTFAAALAGSVLLVALLVYAWSRLAARYRQWQAERLPHTPGERRKAAQALAASLLLPPIAGTASDGLATVYVCILSVLIFFFLWVALPAPWGEADHERTQRRFFAGQPGLVGLALIVGLPAEHAPSLAAALALLVLAAARGTELTSPTVERLGRRLRLGLLAATALLCLGLAFSIQHYAPALPPAGLAMLIPVAIVLQDFAAGKAPRPGATLEWLSRLPAIALYFAGRHSWYDGDSARALAAALCVYGLTYALIRIAAAALALLRTPPAQA